MLHLDDDQALGYLSHALPEEDRATIDRHIDTCVDCRQLLSALAGAITAEPWDDEASDDADDPSARVGSVLAGRFELESVLGRGGMGTVFLARDRAEETTVAVKVMHLDAPGAARFEREARVLARVRHPAVVRYLTHGRSESGEAFLVMEHLAGEDLGKRLQRGPLPVSAAIALVRRVAEGLAVIHAAGVVHRDIKPTNLFLRDGAVEGVTILDFGIARSTRPGSQVTRRGLLLGTPGYMAPEQARQVRELDARADVFALGCVFYECLTGTRAFAGGDLLEVLAHVLLDSPPAPRIVRPEVPVAVDALVQSMLEKDPDRRPEDCRALLEELDRAELVRGAAPQTTRQARRPTLATLGIALILTGALLAGAAGAWAHHVRTLAQDARTAASSPIRAQGSPPAPAPGETQPGGIVPVLVLDFDNRTLDPLLDQILPDAFTRAIDRSDRLEATGAARLHALARDLGDTPLPIDDSLGKALAERDGGRVCVVHGVVMTEGSGYRISVTLRDAATGERLLDTARSASGTATLLPTVAALAWDIRKTLGAGEPRDEEDAVDTELSPSLEADAELVLGQKLLDGGRNREGITHMRRAIELDPDNALFHAAYGSQLFATGEPGAETELAVSLAHDHGICHKEHLIVSGTYHYLRAEDSLAADELGELIELRPHAVAPTAILVAIYERHGQLARALATAQRVEKLHPHDDVARANALEYEILNNELAPAVAESDRLLHDFPRVGVAAEFAALARALAGDLEGAQAAWQVVEPDDAVLANLGRGDLAIYRGDWAGAVDPLRAATKQEHGSPTASTSEAWSVLAEVEAHRGDKAAALAAARRALGPAAGPGTTYRTGHLLLSLGQTSQVASIRRRLEAVASPDGQVDARLFAGEVALSHGDDEGAGREFRAALAIKDVERIHEALARAAQHAGDIAGASRELQTCLARLGEAALDNDELVPTLRAIPPLRDADTARAP